MVWLVEDEISGEDVVSLSNQVCGIDLLEKIIDEAKTNTKTLFSSMESLISLMKEVESGNSGESYRTSQNESCSWRI
ncbi:hypothetical protein K1719_037436 [Acacia pycnantha]|nr:hypothetical protein K1719_037436 [Acacia pycnantha]